VLKRTWRRRLKSQYFQHNYVQTYVANGNIGDMLVMTLDGKLTPSGIDLTREGVQALYFL